MGYLKRKSLHIYVHIQPQHKARIVDGISPALDSYMHCLFSVPCFFVLLFINMKHYLIAMGNILNIGSPEKPRRLNHTGNSSITSLEMSGVLANMQVRT